MLNDNIQLLHNQKIYINNSNYKEVLKKTIKNRNDYLNINEVNLIENKVKRFQNILFLSNDLNETLSYNDYQLIIYGILPCGSKTTLIINSIYPSVDIEYDENFSNDENLENLKSLFKDEMLKKSLKGKQLDVKDIKIISGKKFMLYNDKESKFIRIRFRKLFHRNSFIKLLNKNNIISFNNDVSSYYRTVSRTYKINLSGWNKLQNYKVILNSNIYKTKYVFEISIKDIIPYTDELYEREFKDININLIRKDNMISMAFDIEQYSSDFDINKPNRDTRLPSGKIAEDIVFNIGMTYQFINESNSFLNIGLVTKEANIHKDYLTIICKSEKVLLQAFGYINNLLQPDFIYEFNGSGFDWPNLYDKYKHHHILDYFCQDMSIRTLSSYELKLENMEKNFFVEEFIKISADRLQQKMCNIKLPGYIAFDVRVVFMQLNPTESKSSLKFYLELNNLPSKDDMPIPELFRHYLTGNIEGLTNVVHYCYIDCFRLHQLIYKNNIIQDKRAVGLLSYTSIFDTFYRANGCKVRNLIIANAFDNNLFVNSIKKEEREEDKMNGKYPGALVLDPKRGLVNNTLTFKEFCNEKLEINDFELIEQVQQIINKNYESVFIKKNIDEVIF